MLTINVASMTCGHCVATVTKAVQSVHPGLAVSVDLEHGVVTMPDDADAGAVRRAIAAAGYDAIPAGKTSCCCG